MSYDFWQSDGKDILTSLRSFASEPCVFYLTHTMESIDIINMKVLSTYTSLSRLEITAAEETTPLVFRCSANVTLVANDNKEPKYHFQGEVRYKIWWVAETPKISPIYSRFASPDWLSEPENLPNIKPFFDWWNKA